MPTLAKLSDPKWLEESYQRVVQCFHEAQSASVRTDEGGATIRTTEELIDRVKKWAAIPMPDYTNLVAACQESN